MKEVRIAGGGLAGLSLALGLRGKGIPVVVSEAGSYPRHRVCGEFISGVGASTLEALGIDFALADAKRYREVAWFREGRELLRASLPEPALCLSRCRLDDRLQQAFRAAGGVLRTNERRTREAAEGLVWAAGRLPTKSPWIGLKCHVEGLGMEESLEMHLGSNGYLGLAPIEDGRVNVCGLFRVDRTRQGKGSELLFDYLEAGGHAELISRMRSGTVDEASFSGVAGFQLGLQVVEDDLCAIGDAWGMIPPFTGNGMSMAFESAELALPWIDRWSRGELAWTEVVANLRNEGRRLFRRRLRIAMGLHHVLMAGRGQDLVEALSARGWLPFRPLLSLVR